MVSYHARHQQLICPATPSSTSKKFCKVTTFFSNIQIFLEKKWRFITQKYAVFGSKVWEFWVKTMGVTLRLRRTNDKGRKTKGGRLPALDSCLTALLSAKHKRSSKSVDSWQLFVIYKTKFRRC